MVGLTSGRDETWSFRRHMLVVTGIGGLIRIKVINVITRCVVLMEVGGDLMTYLTIYYKITLKPGIHTLLVIQVFSFNFNLEVIKTNIQKFLILLFFSIIRLS